MSAIRLHKQGISVAVRLTPAARREEIGGLADGTEGKMLKVSVTAPPEDGKANRALVALLSKKLGIPKSAFSFLSGETSRNKVLLIAGEGPVLIQKLSSLQ